VVAEGTQQTLTKGKTRPKTEIIFGNEEGEVEGEDIVNSRPKSYEIPH